jgi:hypothetical protein
MHALLFQRADHSFHHAVLFGRVRRDELLAKSVAAHQLRIPLKMTGYSAGT